MAMKNEQKLPRVSPGVILKLLFTSLLLLLVPVAAQAEQSKVFGNYTIHYSAFTTDNLTPSVAKQYNIPRSKKRALLNVSVLKKTDDGSSKPSSAVIRGTTTNLNQQLRELNPREISEKGAIYYIAETPVDHGEILKYNLEVTPEGEKITYTLSFQEQFYTE
jgi:uncharacterized protein DUF4426